MSAPLVTLDERGAHAPEPGRGIVDDEPRQIVMISVDSEDPDDDDVTTRASKFDVVGVHDGRSRCDDDGHEHVGIRGVLERARVGLVASLVGTDGSKAGVRQLRFHLQDGVCGVRCRVV